MRNLFASQRFLMLYSGALTVVFAITVLCGFTRFQAGRFDQITVHRINIVEPDGTIRMVLSDKANAPGAYIKNKEYPHTSRSSAGLLFFDEEGTEDGGLIYGISRDSKGRVNGSNVHLSFDKYMQDQTFTIDAGQEDKKDYSTLTMQDRGDYSILEALDASNRINALPEAQRAAEWKKFAAIHPGDHTRVILGRASDGASTLRLKDPQGRDRIVLRVAPDGSPVVETLDANGQVLAALPSR